MYGDGGGTTIRVAKLLVGSSLPNLQKPEPPD
jgi:hypothetical protein